MLDETYGLSDGISAVRAYRIASYMVDLASIAGYPENDAWQVALDNIGDPDWMSETTSACFDSLHIPPSVRTGRSAPRKEAREVPVVGARKVLRRRTSACS